METNPYRAPSAERDERPVDADRRPAEVGQAVMDFEKLRILYNSLLLAMVCLQWLLMSETWIDQPRVIAAKLTVGCLGANLCFSAGTIFCGYLAYLGHRHRIVHWGLFLLGTVLSVPLVISLLHA